MAIEDKYKPFWETEDNSQSSPDLVIGDDNSSTIETSLQNSKQSGQDIIKDAQSENNSFTEYLAREKNRKPRKDSSEEIIRKYVNLKEKNTTSYSSEYSSSSNTISTIIAFIIGIGIVLLVGYFVIDSIQNVGPAMNTTAWSNNTLTSIGGTTNNMFGLGLLSPTVLIIFVAINLMLFTGRRSIIPFIITFFMVTMAIMFFNAPIILLTIPGIVLFWKMQGLMSIA